jgi:hypothetical protein
MGPRPSVRGVEPRARRKGPRASSWECLAVCSLTPRDRGRVLEQGRSIRQAARQAAVPRQTASKWVARYRAEVRQGCKTARRDPTGSPVGYPSASYARSSCCVGSAWGATGLLEGCIPRARRSTGIFAGLACSGSRVLNPYPIRTATSGLTPVIRCSTWTPRSWAAWAPLVRYSGGRSEDLSGAGRDGTSKDLCAGRGPSAPIGPFPRPPPTRLAATPLVRGLFQ